MEIRNTVDYIKLFFKGVVMGMADAILGVSGGTIAFLLGLYEELISTISGLNFSLTQNNPHLVLFFTQPCGQPNLWLISPMMTLYARA